MYIEQIYTGCLAEAAYYIESEGEAVVIDPIRDTAPYLRKAEERGARIRYVLETHFHADFVSGHLDLAERVQATIVFGPGAETSYKAHIAEDGEIIRIGKIHIEVLHTPGHTPESCCYLLYDESGKPHSLFSGDTLFIGDVGRPDLAVSSALTERDLAGMLYDSLRNRVMPLPDEVMVYPAHGAGSACGKNISSETFATLGHQKLHNYALRDISKQEFIAEVTTGIMPAPAYFAQNAMMNKHGYEQLDELITECAKRLSAREVEVLIDHGAMVIDCRTPMEFAAGHIPGAVFIGLDGQFAIWAATLIKDLHQPIVLVAPTKRHREAILRLARVGFDGVQGYLTKEMRGWTKREMATIEEVNARLLEQAPNLGKIIDVRKPGEYEAGHLESCQFSPLDLLPDNLSSFDPSDRYFIHCKSGYRSMIACSLLKRAGIDDLYNVSGGFDALQNTRLPITSKTNDHILA